MILTTLLLFFITIEILIVINYVTYEKELRVKSKNVYELIIELQNQIGYLGLIHNFKNYVLRPTDTNYREKALINYIKAVKQVKQLETASASILGQFEMTATRTMLNAYKERLDILPQLIESNTSAREVDKFVRYDDKPSREEIDSISKKINNSLNVQFSTVLYNSFVAALITLCGLVVTLLFFVQFYLKEQKQSFKASKALNDELKKNKLEIERSQTILLSVIKDVESEKKSASLLNDKLTSKNKEMEQFIYTVSHDLKSPLVTISGFTHNLIKELSEVLTEKQRYRFNRIIENVNNMGTLLTDLLDLSKIVQQSITLSKVDVTKLINNQKIVLENVIIETNTVIIIADKLATIIANERLLSEAILNLLSNAIRYRETSRQLVIEIFTTETDTKTTLHIKDNGIGIDPKYQQLVFGIFERLSTIEGTGVGLTIVRTIMEKHKGNVLLVSALGEGCCFSLEFPNTTTF